MLHLVRSNIVIVRFSGNHHGHKDLANAENNKIARVMIALTSLYRIVFIYYFLFNPFIITTQYESNSFRVSFNKRKEIFHPNLFFPRLQILFL